MKNNTLAIVIVLVSAIVSYGVASLRPATVETVVKEESPESPYEVQVGAVSSPDSPSPYFSFGQLRRWNEKKALNTATTTACAIKSPSATSSLDLKATGIRFDVSSTTASVVTIAKATTPFATTTLIGNQYSIGANAQATILASTTATQQVASIDVLAPNTYIVFGIQGGTGTFSPTGQCQASFIEM